MAIKLHNMVIHLAAWSKQRFLNAYKKIEGMKTELQTLVNKLIVQYDQCRIQHINKEIEALWRQEEMFWGMRSRIKWLKWGDRNTKFFMPLQFNRVTETAFLC